MTAPLYLEHLTDPDLSLLAGVEGMRSVDELLSYLRANPGYLEALLRRPALFAALFGSGEGDALLRASPFLIFAVLVHRAAHDLDGVSFVDEWLGPGRRVPMFEVNGLRAFAGDSLRRLFLAELLASYTRVASGSFWMQTARGWRRRRFSDLDPLRLVELLDALPEAERPALYRRLGDLTLFLTGVFPDYAGGRFLAPIARQRLRRAVLASDRANPLGSHESTDPVWLLEELGRRSYRLAGEASERIGGSGPGLLIDVADGFGQARCLLNFLTDRYLFPHRENWFPLSGS